MLDGEIVAFDDEGRPSFERLQARMHLASDSAVRRRMRDIPATYVIFDLLYLDGHTTMSLSYEERRELLERLELEGPAWRTPSYHRGEGRALLAATKELGIEGIVAKKLDCPYHPGQRASHWIKVKNVHTQDVVIGGWTPGEGGRSSSLGSLAVGVMEGDDLVYAGKVGTGFTESSLALVKRELEPLARDTSPFKRAAAAEGHALRGAEARGARGVPRMDEERDAPGALVQGPAAGRLAAGMRARRRLSARRWVIWSMPSAIWSGAISFGLVNIPVKLYSAVSRKTVRFHQIDAESGQRIRQQRVNPATGDEVPYEQIVKGYEISPDKYVTITPEELDALEPQKTRTIDIEEFVDLEQIDPIFYDHPYWLVPDKGAGKAYKLLLDAMSDADKVAIARVVIRSKENLVALRSYNGAITMETMLFPDEVVQPDSIEELSAVDSDVKTTKRELDMAKQLIESLSADFDPSQFKRRVPRARARHDRAEGGGRDDHHRGARAGAQGGPGPHGRARGVDRLVEEPAEEEGGLAQQRLGVRQEEEGSSEEVVGCTRHRRRSWKAALPFQSGQGAVSRRGVHQGARHRLLHARRAGGSAAPADRPLTLKRYPNGVEGGHFYEKQCPSHRPDWVRSEPVDLSSKTIDFCVCDDLATLVWLANLADLELHPSLSKVPGRGAPDGDGVRPRSRGGRRAGRVLRGGGDPAAALDALGLECLPKTSGSKGIQVYVPLNVEDVDYDHGTKRLSQALARHLEAEHPKLIVSSQKKELRKNKVLIDWSQNDEHKTTVGVYSLRARERPTVSTPLLWDEVGEGDPDALVFEADDVLARVEEHGDLFAPVAELRQSLPQI